MVLLQGAVTKGCRRSPRPEPPPTRGGRPWLIGPAVPRAYQPRVARSFRDVRRAVGIASAVQHSGDSWVLGRWRRRGTACLLRSEGRHVGEEWVLQCRSLW